MTHDTDDTETEADTRTRADLLKAILTHATTGDEILVSDGNTATAAAVTTETAEIPFDRFDRIRIEHGGEWYNVVETPDGLAIEREEADE